MNVPVNYRNWYHPSGRGHCATPIPGPTEDSNAKLGEFIYQSLSSLDGVCFLENAVASASDPWLRKAKSNIATYGSEVYHVIASRDIGNQKIVETIREASQIPVFIGAAGQATSESVAHKVVTAETLKHVAETAQLVFVGAYDGEGYLVWRRIDVKGRVAKPLRWSLDLRVRAARPSEPPNLPERVSLFSPLEAGSTVSARPRRQSRNSYCSK